MMKVAIAQVNPTVGDLDGNYTKLLDITLEAKKKGANLVVFPESFITGYPSLDLIFNKSFIKKNKEIISQAIENSPKEIIVIVGFIDYDKHGNKYNAAAIYSNNKLIKIVHKTLLPTYDVFDEARYFEPEKPENIQPVSVKINDKEISLGVEICEDLWDSNYSIKVSDLLVERGADIIINISASPFYIGKGLEREKIVSAKAASLGKPFIYCNLVGGQDELVFDGQSLISNSEGRIIFYGKKFEEEISILSLDSNKKNESITRPIYNREEEMYNAIVLGIRDYFRKTGFKKAIIGLSGGIDSSLVACLAKDALGAENVIGVSMPSKYSSDHSKNDAQELAKNLGILFVEIPIQDIVNAYMNTLLEPLKNVRDYFKIKEERDDHVADENIQPRVRGNCLMDFSNRLADLKILVLNTGNKTELALGYCTLYGDMTGGLSVIGDVNKLDVYKLANYVNEKNRRNVIPLSVFTKKPSAELRENQFDPFDFNIVSPLVDEIIENSRSKHELINMGYPIPEVEDVYKRIIRAEYKRWQAPPTIKITKKAFGRGWRMPIVNKYNEIVKRK